MKREKIWGKKGGEKGGEMGKGDAHTRCYSSLNVLNIFSRA